MPAFQGFQLGLLFAPAGPTQCNLGWRGARGAAARSPRASAARKAASRLDDTGLCLLAVRKRWLGLSLQRFGSDKLTSPD